MKVKMGKDGNYDPELFADERNRRIRQVYHDLGAESAFNETLHELLERMPEWMKSGSALGAKL